MKCSIFDESADFLENPNFREHKFLHNIVCKTINIKNSAMQEINQLDIGKYYIINSPKLHTLGIKVENQTLKIFKSYLLELLKDLGFNSKSSVLVVGLGNQRILSDSLGFEVFSNVLMTRGFLDNTSYRNVSGIAPDIYAKTGIESFDIVSALVNLVSPDFVIVVDSLATNNIDRLGSSFQITNSSLSAGSAMNSKNKTFSKQTLNTECIFLGVPLMFKLEDNFLTPNDIDIKVNKCAKIIYKTLNEILHPYFDEKEVQEFL